MVLEAGRESETTLSFTGAAIGPVGERPFRQSTPIEKRSD